LPHVTLSNGRDMPLVGFGVGNLQHDKVAPVVQTALTSGEGYFLLDTAKASQNEELISDGIAHSLDFINTQHPHTPVHIVTKVWYTHLGYERTRLSVQESIDALLSKVKTPEAIRIHFLLHWPRCDESIEWMNCEEEENNLPKHIKDAGPAPHLDRDNAWKGSWKALEDMYDDESLPIQSIGVSNFYAEDLNELLDFCRHRPYLYQGNVWILLNDINLMRILDENDILFQAYNVMNGIIGSKHQAPRALADLARLGASLDENDAFSPSLIVLAWLVQNNISIIPRASSERHLSENSPTSIAEVPLFTDEQHAQIRHCVAALLRGEDYEHKLVAATFVNSDSAGKPVHVYWESHDGEEIPVREDLQPGESHSQETYPGHRFVVYDDTGELSKVYQISVGIGGSERFHIEL